MSTDVAAALAARREELERELAALAAPPDATGAISFGKRVGDGTAMAVERFANVSVHDRLRTTLADVERAQAKLAEGSYGSCDRCGDQIPAARLEARPWSTLCLACASEG